MVSLLCFITDAENRIDIILTSDPGKWYCATSVSNPVYIIQAHSDCKYQSHYVNFLLIEIIYILFVPHQKQVGQNVLSLFVPFLLFNTLVSPAASDWHLVLSGETVFRHLFYLLLKYATLRKIR